MRCGVENVGRVLRAGIDVIIDLNPAIFHQKFGESTAAVMTGSTSFTLADTGSNSVAAGGRGAVVGNNLNYVLIVHGRQAASQFLVEFERMRAGNFGELRERVEPRPREFTLERVRVKPLFAPRHGPEMEIMKQMLEAEPWCPSAHRRGAVAVEWPVESGGWTDFAGGVRVYSWVWGCSVSWCRRRSRISCGLMAVRWVRIWVPVQVVSARRASRRCSVPMMLCPSSEASRRLCTRAVFSVGVKGGPAHSLSVLG